jgi:multidrug transporter EmrE-like cation transporter
MESINDTINEWITRHALRIELTLGWSVMVGFYLLSAIKGITLGVIIWQNDRTNVGRWLKHQKLAETVMFFCLGSLYALVLAMYYLEDQITFDLWERFGIILAIAVSIMLAGYTGVMFVISLRKERWGMPERNARQDQREIEQNLREVNQNERDINRGMTR